MNEIKMPDGFTLMVNATVNGEAFCHAVNRPGGSMTPKRFLEALPDAFSALKNWAEMRFIAPSWESDPRLAEIMAAEQE